MPGSIEKRGKNSWRIVIPDGYEPDGKKRRITETVKFSDDMTEAQQRKECEKIAATLYASAKAGQVVSSRQYTLQEFAEMWLEEYTTTAGLSPVTVEGYKHLLNGRVYPSLGRTKLHQLSAQQITRFYRELLTLEGRGNRGKGKKLSASTVLHYHRLLRSMLNTAVKWGIIAYNPVLNATIPKNDTKPMKAYTPEQTTKLLEALDDAPLQYRIGIILGVLCQLRKGEIAGLEWGDVNFEESTISIARNAVYVPGQGVIIKEPKTRAGKRVITLPQYVIPMLRQLKKEQNEAHLLLGSAWVGSGAMFVQWNGERLHPDTLSKWFHGFLKKQGLPLIRLHDLRHTGISLMFYNGEDASTAAERAGHSKASVTLGVYAHAYKQKDRDATSRLEALVIPKTGEKTGAVPK